jgi:hypothetical protein
LVADGDRVEEHAVPIFRGAMIQYWSHIRRSVICYAHTIKYRNHLLDRIRSFGKDEIPMTGEELEAVAPDEKKLELFPVQVGINDVITASDTVISTDCSAWSGDAVDRSIL